MAQRGADRSHRVLIGLGLAVLGLFLGLSLVPVGILGQGARDLFQSGNVVGPLGAKLAHLLLQGVGLGAVTLPLLAVLWALDGFGLIARPRTYRWTALLVGLLTLVPPLLASLAFPATRGSIARWLVGGYGDAVARSMSGKISWLGSALVLLAALSAVVVTTLGTEPLRRWGRIGLAVLRGVARVWSAVHDGAASVGSRVWARMQALARPPRVETGLWQAGEGEAVAVTPASASSSPEPARRSATKKRRGAARPTPHLPDPGDPDAPDLPPIDLLMRPPDDAASVTDRELDSLGEVLVEKLRTFRVESTIGGRTTGPVVTQFEVIPASGVKVGKIASLADDLALALKAPSIRIIAPIPGKGAVGVEVPNPEPKIVYLRDLLTSDAYRRARAELPLALGEDVNGRAHVADLTRMPHLLIAGVTGSGKSVCINAIISSLIYRHTPERLRLLLIDPKMVELAGYNDLPHLRHPVVTDNADAAGVLKWLVYEMERRYDWLSANNCRNVREYNRRVRSAVRVRAPASYGGDEIEEPEIIPYVVLIIDELADLMMTVQNEVERPLAFLAQKARATGIHLVVATQRPSVNVITGLIKANFSCRVAFRVASKVDSRTIIDQNGAETLLGDGDMLFLPPGEAEPVRIQGTYVSTEDTERIMEWYRARALEREAEAARREADILDIVREREQEEAEVDVAQEVLEDRDPLFRQAAEIVIQNDQGSTSLLQRRLRIGYGRAARIVDQLHHAGILGPSEGSKPREVLVTLDEFERIDLDLN